MNLLGRVDDHDHGGQVLGEIENPARVHASGGAEALDAAEHRRAGQAGLACQADDLGERWASADHGIPADDDHQSTGDDGCAHRRLLECLRRRPRTPTTSRAEPWVRTTAAQTANAQVRTVVRTEARATIGHPGPAEPSEIAVP